MKKRMFFPLLILLWMILSPLAGSSGAPDPVSLFLKGNEAYEKGDYESARDQYQKILDLGIRNGQVYYNLGNAYFRLGETGRAIRNYLLAREFMPGNEDLEANLGYAREEREDRITSSSSGSILREIFFWYDRLTIKEMTYAFLTCNLLFWGALILRLFSRRPIFKWSMALALLVGLTLGGTAAARVIVTHLHTPAVIVVSEASVRSGMDPKSATLFVLHDGAEVTIDQTRGDWRLIRLPSGKKGWVRKEQIGPVVP